MPKILKSKDELHRTNCELPLWKRKTTLLRLACKCVRACGWCEQGSGGGWPRSTLVSCCAEHDSSSDGSAALVSVQSVFVNCVFSVRQGSSRELSTPSAKLHASCCGDTDLPRKYTGHVRRRNQSPATPAPIVVS